MNRYNSYITEWEKKLSNHKIELYYDKDNIKSFYTSFLRGENALLEIIECLCKEEKEVHLYLRIHLWKDWFIIRISGNKRLSHTKKKQIEKEWKNGLITLIEQKDGYIIKLVL